MHRQVTRLVVTIGLASLAAVPSAAQTSCWSQTYGDGTSHALVCGNNDAGYVRSYSPAAQGWPEGADFRVVALEVGVSGLGGPVEIRAYRDADGDPHPAPSVNLILLRSEVVSVPYGHGVETLAFSTPVEFRSNGDRLVVGVFNIGASSTKWAGNLSGETNPGYVYCPDGGYDDFIEVGELEVDGEYILDVCVECDPGPITISGVSQLPDTPDFIGPYVVDADVIANQAPPVTSVELRYSVNDGPFVSLSMASTGGSTYSAGIPGQACLSEVKYYVLARDSGDNGTSFPCDAQLAFSVTPEVTTYCTAKSGLTCGPPSILTQGIASASESSGFLVWGYPVLPNRLGFLLYTDAGRGSQPFQGGILCLAPTSLRRSVPVVSGDFVMCADAFFIDLNSFAQGLLGGSPASFLVTPGTAVNAQWWGRDTAATGSLLSDALEYSICH